MRDAMANAVVGDEVYGDDPTTNKLNRDMAELLGKEAALMTTSGTQANLIAMMLLG
jgi:threonine aldolase